MASPDPRERIIRAAGPMLVSEGYRGLSMDALAARIGMSKRTIYQHFDSKDALVLAAVEDFFERLGAETAVIAGDESIPLLERIERLHLTTARYLQAIPRGFFEDLERNAPEAARFERIRRAAHIRRYLTGLLEQGQKEGLLRDDVPPEIVVEMVLASVDRLGSAEMLATLPVAPRDLPPLVMQIVFSGLIPRTQQRRSRRSANAKKKEVPR